MEQRLRTKQLHVHVVHATTRPPGVPDYWPNLDQWGVTWRGGDEAQTSDRPTRRRSKVKAPTGYAGETKKNQKRRHKQMFPSKTVTQLLCPVPESLILIRTENSLQENFTQRGKSEAKPFNLWLTHTQSSRTLLSARMKRPLRVRWLRFDCPRVCLQSGDGWRRCRGLRGARSQTRLNGFKLHASCCLDPNRVFLWWHRPDALVTSA